MNDDNLTLFLVILCSFVCWVFGIGMGKDMGKTQHTTQPVKPSITISTTNVDGVVVSDTTYTYTFE
jgi:ABC-type proline/glycine betaine transport system permease subunit